MSSLTEVAKAIVVDWDHQAIIDRPATSQKADGTSAHFSSDSSSLVKYKVNTNKCSTPHLTKPNICQSVVRLLMLHYKQNFPSLLLTAGRCSWVMFSWFRPQQSIETNQSRNQWAARTFIMVSFEHKTSLKWERSCIIHHSCICNVFRRLQSRILIAPVPQQVNEPPNQIILLPPCLSSGEQNRAIEKISRRWISRLHGTASLALPASSSLPTPSLPLQTSSLSKVWIPKQLKMVLALIFHSCIKEYSLHRTTYTEGSFPQFISSDRSS